MLDSFIVTGLKLTMYHAICKLCTEMLLSFIDDCLFTKQVKTGNIHVYLSYSRQMS